MNVLHRMKNCVNMCFDFDIDNFLVLIFLDACDVRIEDVQMRVISFKHHRRCSVHPGKVS